MRWHKERLMDPEKEPLKLRRTGGGTPTQTEWTDDPQGPIGDIDPSWEFNGHQQVDMSGPLAWPNLRVENEYPSGMRYTPPHK